MEETQSYIVPALCLPSIILISAADRASYRSCQHNKSSLRPADRLNQIQMLSKIILQSLRIGLCVQVEIITFRRLMLPAGRRRASR